MLILVRLPPLVCKIGLELQYLSDVKILVNGIFVGTFKDVTIN